VPANPEPRYDIIFENAEGSIPKGYPDGPDVFCCIDAFEMERRMKRVLFPKPIGFASAFFDAFRERFVYSPE
jgi:hypothetical protein